MSPTAKTSTRDEEAIRSRTNEFVAAWNQHNPQAMAKVYQDGADMINPFGRVAKSRSEIEKLFKEEHAGSLKESRMALTPEGLRTLTPDVAVADYSFEVTGARDRSGKEISLRGHLTLVLQKQADQWLVAAARPMIPLPDPR